MLTPLLTIIISYIIHEQPKHVAWHGCKFNSISFRELEWLLIFHIYVNYAHNVFFILIINYIILLLIIGITPGEQ